MEITATGYAPKEFTANRANVEQELTQRAQEKDENIQQTKKALEPRPVDQAGADKQGRIDIYA